ncbi:hypothetical protein HELRODRAFT_190143 [Helobdella robusta]|uniref:P/Homo B domain-containing protein n=1 Tax=Helobdella robusta TaxID=6412 RepID=T1FRQ4_HELRO|nr:hypothetical protein HELRODRAFT_190143 [Helobdella robusta]ESO10718.1 hypothetical protein HELRODRAFT_190143 [Helobdella robusta]
MLIKLCSLVQAFLLVITTCQSHYLNQWAVNIEGGEGVAREVAKDHGFVYLGEIMPDYYKFQHPRIMKRSLEANDYHHSSLMSNEKVLWAEQQIVKKRKKRDISNMRAFNDPYWPNMWYLYIVFLTARSANLIADDWVVNGVGRKVSHHYGYGLMDGTAMVEVARNWTPLSEHHRCATQSSSQLVNLTIPSGQSESSVIISNGCQGTDDAVQYLEHVECIVTLRANKRGEVQLFLVSPSGTKSQLLPKREADSSHEGFRNWSFMTTHNWAENPNGSWTLIVTNKETSSNLREWSLVLYGVDREPEIYKRYLPSSTAAKLEVVVNAKADDNKNSNDAGSRFQDGVKQFVGQNSGANNLTNIKSIETKATSTNKTCAKDLYLLKDACLSQCPQGYFPSENDHKCLPCSWECKICRNADGCTVSMEASDQTKWKSATFVVIVLLAIILSASLILLFVFITRRRKNLSSLQDSLFSGENDKNNHNRLIFHGDPLKNSEIHVSSLECSDRNSARAPLLNNEESCSDDEIDLLTANDINRNYQRFDSNNIQSNTFSLP